MDSTKSEAFEVSCRASVNWRCAKELVVLLILSFTQKRGRLWPRLCWGLPSVVVPIDLIHSSPHRLAYVLGFGAISGEILQLFSNGGFVRMVADTTWGFSLSTIIALFSQSLLYFPVFATIDTTIPILGYVIGFFYSSALFSRTILNTIETLTQCFTIFATGASTINVVIGIFSILPIIICQLFLLIWYVWRFCKEVNRLAKRKESFCKALFKREDSNYHATRVKWLLMKYQMKTEGKCIKTVNRLLNFLYKYDPTILYPLRFLASVVVMLIITFLLTLVATTALVELIVPLRDNITRLEGPVSQLAESIDDRLEFFNITNVNVSSLILNTFSVLKDSTSGLAVILPTGPVLAFVWNFFLLVHMITQVHTHLRLLGRGDFSFLPTKLPSPSYRLVAAVRYSGYQIGYFVWAWVIVLCLVWLVGMVGLALYFLLKFFLDQTLYVLAALATPLIYSTLLYYAQLLLCKLFFVGDTNNKHTVITNIRVFHWFTYIMFFQNVVVGVTSALLRIFYSIGFGLLLLFRLDRVVLMRGFENYDGGHKTYIGFLYLEHTLNNPVLNVFVSLLLEVADGRKRSDGDEGSGTAARKERREEEEEGEEEGTKTRGLQLVGTTKEEEEGGESRPVETQRRGPRVSRQAANRWLVAYTLLRNESIRTLTASQLRENPLKQKGKKKHKKKLKSKAEQKETEEGGGEKAEEAGVTRVIMETPEPSELSGASLSDQQGSRNETSSMEDTNL